MTISLSDVSKRFNREWIFRKISYRFTAGHTYAITGPNGSGKSTLLQVIGGAVVASAGKISYHLMPDAGSGHPNGGEGVEADDIFKYVSFVTPYLEVVEEMTANEFLHFHQKFKPFLPDISISEMLSIIGLEKAANKQIRYYSSGMKQRIKLAQGIFSDTPIVLLDEPCTNLDEEGIQLYHRLIESYCKNRLLIVSSNDIQEYGFCDETLCIMNYKGVN